MNIAMGLVVAAASFAATHVSVAPDGMLLVNGERTFVIGLYEYPTEDTVLEEIAEAGFNLVQASMDRAQLERLDARGIGAWINTGYSLDLGENSEERKAALTRMAQEFGSHRALWVWEVPDEALWNVWYGATMWRAGAEIREQNALIDALEDKAKAERLREMRRQAGRHWHRAEFKESEQLADAIWRELGKEPPQPKNNMSNAAERAARLADGMLAGYTYLKQIDPHHPVWMNHAPRNSVAQRAVFNRAADAVGCDIYPVPAYLGGHSDLADRGLTSVGAYTRTMQEAAPGKPVWMVLQGFGWADLPERKNDPDADTNRPPTHRETRFMAFDAIVNGARAILYWGTAYTDKTKPFWPDFLRAIREVADLQPVLSAPDATLDIDVALEETWGTLDRGIRVLPKQTDEGVWLIVVNEWSDPLRYTLRGLQSLNGTNYHDTAADVHGQVKDGALVLTIESYGVQVLKPTK